MPPLSSEDRLSAQQDILDRLAELHKQCLALSALVKQPEPKSTKKPDLNPAPAQFVDLSSPTGPKASSSRKRKPTSASTQEPKRYKSSASQTLVPAGTFVGVQVPQKVSPNGAAGDTGKSLPGSQAPPICVRCTALGGYRGYEEHICDKIPGRSCSYCRGKKQRCEEVPQSMWKPADVLVCRIRIAHNSKNDEDITDAKMEGINLRHRLDRCTHALSGEEVILRTLDEILSIIRVLIGFALQDRGEDPRLADDLIFGHVRQTMTRYHIAPRGRT